MKKFFFIIILNFVLISNLYSHENPKFASFICKHIDHGYDYQFFIDLENSFMKLGPFSPIPIDEINDSKIYSSLKYKNQINYLVFERYSGSLLNTVTNLTNTEIIRTNSYKCTIAKKIF